MNQKEQIDKINQTLWQNRYSKPAENFNNAQQVEEEAKKTKHCKGVAYAKLNMAMACFLQSKNMEAFEQVGFLVEYFYENQHEIGYIHTLNLQASLFESIGDYEKGLTLALKAFKNAKENNAKDAEADAASILGLIYTRLCNFNKAIDNYQNAIKIREEQNDFAGVASSLNRMGMIFRLTKDYEQAIHYYSKSLEIREKNNLITSIPWTMLGIASTYEDMGNLNEALNCYQKGMINSDKKNIFKNPVRDAVSSNNVPHDLGPLF